MMFLKIYLPATCFLEKQVLKVKGESPLGEFCLKPRHIDYVTALVPGLFSYVAAGGTEFFLAVDNGTLVKQGDQVFVATRRAVAGELGRLNVEIERMLTAQDERERRSRADVAQLEAGFLRRFLEFSRRRP